MINKEYPVSGEYPVSREYHFYGWQDAGMVRPVITERSGMIACPEIETPLELYDALTNIWCAETCAPRMRARWTPEDKTLGQCSITAFLAQDLFGGKVYGVPLGDGNYHCYNVAGGCCFDLTSEQFHDRKLDYDQTDNPEQFREIHFAKEEKRLRYEYLKAQLLRLLKSKTRE